MRRTEALLTTIFIGLAIAVPGLAETPRYTVTPLPPLETPDGLAFHPFERPFIHVEINNAGQVVATMVRDGGFGEGRAVRYTLGGEVESLLPPGAASSVALGMNERGQVFGIALDARGEQQDVFIETPGEGFDFLENGKGDRIRRAFHFNDMNDHGDVVGTITFRGTPVIYTREEGWRDLSPIDSRIVDAWLLDLNNRGDIVFQTPITVDGANSYLWTEGEIFRLGGPTSQSSAISVLNDAALLAGEYRDETNRWQAFVFSSEGGHHDLPTRKFRQSFALKVTENGIVAGTVHDRGWLGIFVYNTKKPGSKVRVIAQSSDFRRIMPPGVTFVNNISIGGINERLQVAGEAMGHNRNGINFQIPFVASAKTGVVNLEAFMDTGTIHVNSNAFDINDRGDILIRVDAKTRKYLILSPADAGTLTP